MKTLYPFFKWANDTWLGQTISNSIWLFPAIEGVHIVALALLFGAIRVLNLRLMRVMMRDRSLPQLSRELDTWTLTSLVVILVTGAMLFASEAVKSFYSAPFRLKIVLLVAAIIFHYAISRRLMRKEDSEVSPALGKVAGAVAIVLWMGVGFAGRAIGFF